jgi:hypothetical protein
LIQRQFSSTVIRYSSLTKEISLWYGGTCCLVEWHCKYIFMVLVMWVLIQIMCVTHVCKKDHCECFLCWLKYGKYQWWALEALLALKQIMFEILTQNDFWAEHMKPTFLLHTLLVLQILCCLYYIYVMGFKSWQG